MTEIEKELATETRIDIQRQHLVCPYCDSVMRVIYTRSMDVSENIDVPLFCKKCHAGVGGVSSCGIVSYERLKEFDELPLMAFDAIRSHIYKKELEAETKEYEQSQQIDIKGGNND